MSHWAFCIFAALASFLSTSTALVAAVSTNNQNEHFLRKIPLDFFKSLMESNACDPTYDDYESCENFVPTNFVRKNSMDPSEYGSSDEENDIMKLLSDVSTTKEEKRGRSQAGCDCQLRSEYVDLGPSTYPRYVKNVTCDEHRRCYQSRSKGYQCHPIHYKVSVIKLRNKQLEPHEYGGTEIHLPRELRCCWKASFEQTVVGCICGPQN